MTSISSPSHLLDPLPSRKGEKRTRLIRSPSQLLDPLPSPKGEKRTRLIRSPSQLLDPLPSPKGEKRTPPPEFSVWGFLGFVRERWARYRGATRNRESGYNLVVMVIVITVFNVMVATAWPLWSAYAQREREEELIFRGLQYAEAIRVFQLRFGRYPNRLQELVELEPRCLRQLWEDPLSEDGSWGVIYGGSPAAGGGKGGRAKTSNPMAEIIQERQERARDETKDEEPPPNPPDRGGGSNPSSGGRQPGPGRPIVGVYSKSQESGFKSFFGQTSYGEWKFTAELVSQPPMGPNGVRTPHIGKRTIGKPFRGDIGIPGAGGLGAGSTENPGKRRDGGVQGRPGPAEPGGGK